MGDPFRLRCRRPSRACRRRKRHHLLDYDALGRIIQEAFRPHRPEADRDEALPETDWQNPDHDLILLHKFRNVRYRYDGNGKTGATTAVQLDNVMVGNQTIDETPGKDQFVRKNAKWEYEPILRY